MTTKEDRYQIYKDCFEKLPVNQGGLARVMNLGEPLTKSARNKISDKLNQAPNKGITKQEALAIQLLLLLNKEGIPPDLLEFDNKGRLKNLKKQKK